MNLLKKAKADYNSPHADVLVKGIFCGHTFQATAFGHASEKTLAFHSSRLPARYRLEVTHWLLGKTQQRRLFRLLAGEGNPRATISSIVKVTAWPF